MNLVWTPKSGNTGPVLLCSDAVARLLIAKGSAIDLDSEQIVTPLVERVEAKAVAPKASPKKKIKPKNKKK